MKTLIKQLESYIAKIKEAARILEEQAVSISGNDAATLLNKITDHLTELSINQEVENENN